MTASASSARSRTTVLFDRDCGFCQWTVGHLRGLDRHHRLEFLPLQSASATEGRPDLAEVARCYPLTHALHTVAPDGRVSAGGYAMLEILDLLPGGWLLRPWARLPFVTRIVDVVYYEVAKRRHRLGSIVRHGETGMACAIGPASPR